MDKVEFDHNIILYGPPGTGKTYTTMAFAVAIIEGRAFEDVRGEISEDYGEVKARYEEYKEAGQIAFTTFHQSYGYEEFIEGIKPIIDENSDNSVGYSIEAGSFKRFCTAAKGLVNENGNRINYNACVWEGTIRPFDVAFEKECIQTGVIRYYWKKDDAYELLNRFKDDVSAGDYILLNGKDGMVHAIGRFDEGDAYWDETKDHHQWTRKVSWLAKDLYLDVSKYNAGRRLSTRIFSRVASISVDSMADILNQIGVYKVDQAARPYVFIIDEINRGNISKIFGELITLIEESKRDGCAEAASAILPYSGELFSVPGNVYIIGTMNTADRSIALMDTALRRRFSFKEMMPDPNVLREIGADIIIDQGETLDVALMLEIINKRIEYLYDREHTIGHAFFTCLKDDPTIERLASVFEKSVIPLLQEYFYEDYGKIQLVLGDNGKTGDNKQFQFIRDDKLNISEVFSANPEVDIPENKYSLQKEAFRRIESYKLIGKGL